MQNYGLVSIITPSWNCATFIAETIISIQSQTYTDWELLILDDYYTYDTKIIVSEFVEKNYCKVRN